MKSTTLSELRKQDVPTSIRSVKDEIRNNLLCRLDRKEPIFSGIVGYEDSVIPGIINALLSRHNLILLGLRGQAKSRILRSISEFLDEEIPYIEGCEIHDDPFFPICSSCRRRLLQEGDQLPIAYWRREERFVEKLATPDVTIADIIGDLDPIKAAKKGTALSEHENILFGLLPRAHRGIFAINELPDLAPKIQVGLFNIMQEGDVQIKGFPIRLPLDVLLVFSANPEDYTARGKIITPLKDRIGSEIKTHYPRQLGEGIKITLQESWTRRNGRDIHIPGFVMEAVEWIAFTGRQDSRVDKRSGVSQRLPIACLENTVSNAERRAVSHGEPRIVPRIADIYASLPAITGKLELEYEGELKGGDTVARELIVASVLKAFTHHFQDENFDQIIQWFNLGGEVKVSDQTSAIEYLKHLKQIQGLEEKWVCWNIHPQKDPELAVSTAEFILEGLYAQKKLSRNEERGYFKEAEKLNEEFYGDFPHRKKTFN
ncbi:MAG: magnesium chelatase [Acidobacteria bacterium]|nr:magnesium chelatase [Acidobacteriota bacterium]